MPNLPTAPIPGSAHPNAGAARRRRALLAAVGLPLLALLCLGRALPARAAGTVTTCTNQALVTAMTGGGLVTFNCGLLTHTIVITQTGGLLVAANTTLDGGGRIILSGGHAERLFAVPAGRTLTLMHITLADGTQPGGEAGALYNQGTIILDHVLIRDSSAGGPLRVAGAIYNDSTGRVVARQSQFLRNSASQGGAIFNVHGGVLDISDSQFISNSVLGQDGGAIYNNGTLTLTGSAFSGNVVSRTVEGTGDPHGGGGLSNDVLGRAILADNVFTANQVMGLAYFDVGGGLFSQGVLTLTSGAFTHNSAGVGGGMALHGQAAVFSATATDNSAGSGGGLEAGGSGPVLVQGLLALGNHATSGGGLQANNPTLRVLGGLFQANDAEAGGGVVIQDDTVISNSTFIGNTAAQGGGIYKGFGTLGLYASTLVGNHASGQGGALLNHKNLLVVENVTVSGNSAADSGGALYNTQNVTFRNVTVYGNSAVHGGGVYASNQTAITLTNSIIANSPSGGNCSGAALTSSAYSLSSDNLCGLSGPGDHNLTDPKLSALGNYGGPTLTYMPASDSPAVDGVVGSNAPLLDQRGQPRPFGPGIDIGAVERQLNDTGLLPRLYLALVRR